MPLKIHQVNDERMREIFITDISKPKISAVVFSTKLVPFVKIWKF